MSFGAPPVIPEDLQQYNSYVVDPIWQRKFTIIWGSVLGAIVIFSLPRVSRYMRTNGAKVHKGMLFGIWEEDARGSYRVVEETGRSKPLVRRCGGRCRRVEVILRALGTVFYWTPPGIELDLGQIILIIGYMVTVTLCIVIQAPLISNSNRAGFMALAQFPVVFLFATKNSILSLLLGPGNGYEKLNFIHRWSGRGMFIGAVLHGSLWIHNHIQWDLPILGQQKETSGVAALGLLCVIVLTSLRPARKYFYQMFFILHVLAFVAFFVTICYHTIYASPWIFPPLAFLGADFVLRLLRYRIKDAILVPVSNQMTLIHVPHCSDGWTPGQHVLLRVFFSGRIFESHPLTIFSAPPSVTCITSFPNGINLGARAVGDWTRALNTLALEGTRDVNNGEKLHAEMNKADNEQHKTQAGFVPVQVMIDGPYGGCGVDLGEYENVLLVAGGSGATFTVGLLDDIVGRCVRLGRARNERTRRIEFVWCMRSFGAMHWFAPALADIAKVAAEDATLDVHISVFVTCLCNPDAVPDILNCDVTTRRPVIYDAMVDLVSPPTSKRQWTADVDGDAKVVMDTELGREPGLSESGKLPWIGEGGGLAVCASGPAGLTRETSNAVVRLQMSKLSAVVGSVGLHCEVFAI